MGNSHCLKFYEKMKMKPKIIQICEKNSAKKQTKKKKEVKFQTRFPSINVLQASSISLY